jgi:hypothetical protein
MADLPYDLYAAVDYDISRGGRSSDISIDRLSPGLNVREAKGDYQSDLSTNYTLTSRPGGIAPSFRSFGSLKLRLICVCLHLLLVLVHLALVVGSPLVPRFQDDDDASREYYGTSQCDTA